MKKKLLLLLTPFLIFISCTQDEVILDESSKSNDGKITICHKGKNTISISINALRAHLNHGDKIGRCGYTYVPDDNFEQALIDLGLDDSVVLDNEVPTSNISEITYLNINGNGIEDLTGIEDFVSLTSLFCGNNLLTNIDLSNNQNLITLYCPNNQFSNLDLSGNPNLATLYCQNNNLTALNLSENSNLNFLFCDNNSLTSLDLSNKTALDFVYCRFNQLTSINLENTSNLRTLNCNNNELTNLDTSQSIELRSLSCSINQLENLELMSNTNLSSLYCFSNQIVDLDLSSNTSLRQLTCYNNNLESLNVKNGNNTNFINFDARFNSNLICIQVDDATYSTTNWTLVDATSSFSEDCGY